MTVGMPTQTRAASKGLSLLEVLIAIIIIAVASSIFMVSSRSSLTGNERSKMYGDAAVATKEVMAAVQLMTLAEVDLLNATDMADHHSQGAGVAVKATARVIAAGDVTDIASLDATTLRHVTLATTFKNKTGGNVTKTFTTIVYKP